VKFRFVASHHQEYPVATMCRVRCRFPSVATTPGTHVNPACTVEKMLSLLTRSKAPARAIDVSLGAHVSMQNCIRKGFIAPDQRVARLMQELELAAKRPRHPTGHERFARKEHQSLRTCSNRTFMLISQTRNGRVRPPPSGHKRDGYILRWSLICSRSWWWDDLWPQL
jgi:hypothetical protein